jgi:hypothetical protein
VTGATLADDQEKIDDDQATLFNDQQSLAAAVLTSPVAGTVVAMGIVAGQVVSSGSTTAVITVISANTFEATATLTAANAATVAVGDIATVSVVGVSDPMQGTVTRVGPVDVSAGNTYPLVIALPTGSHGIYTGSTAQITVQLQVATDALVVPTPAVHTTSVGHPYVLTLHGGATQKVPVKVGVIGTEYTQVTSGVRAGEPVVLAQLTTPVPTSNDTSPFGGVSALNGSSSFTFRGPRGATFNISKP